MAIEIDLAGKTVLVTGGASGIGRAAVELFAEAGASVVVADWNEQAAVEVARSTGGAMAVGGDVSKEEDVARMIHLAVREHGRLDVLINNASVGPSARGVYAMKRLIDSNADNWDAVLGVSLRGVALCAKFAYPHLLKTGGTIVNNSSINALVGFIGSDAYTAAKGGITALTRSLATDWGPSGVRVNCVCPGAVDTPMVRHRYAPPGTMEATESAIPLRRVAGPRDVAKVFLFLASDLASYVHGATVVADGGWTASAHAGISTEDPS